MSGYENYTLSPVPWIKQMPEHWGLVRGKNLYQKMQRPTSDTDEVVTCFRDGTVTLRKNRRTTGFTESLKEIGYQGIRKGDLVIHVMDAFAGSIGVSDSDGKGTPVYSVCQAKGNSNNQYYALLLREMARSGYIQSLYRGIRERSSDFRFEVFAAQFYPVPPREEQDQIVRFLDWKVSSINKLINIQKEQIRVIEELKEKAVCEVLLHGIDVGVSYKDSGIEWIGSIPERWKVIKIKWLFDEVDERNTDQTTELLTFSKKRGLLPFAEASDKMPSASDLSNYKILHKGQLLENRMQAWHGMFICSDREGCVSPDYSIFSASKEREVSVKFYEYVFRSHIWVEQFANASRGVGSGFNRLYTPQFGAIHTVYPAIDEQRRIVEYLDKKTARLNAVITQIERRIEGLEELKLTLIADTVTGKIDVRGIDVPEYEYVEETIDDNNEDCEEETEEQED